MRYCLWPRCSVKVKTGYCTLHESTRKKIKPDNRPSAADRGYDGRWHRFKNMYLSRNPACEWCGEPAEEIHHIIPLKDGGKRLSVSNVVALCRVCHRRVRSRVK